nr:TIGR02710 family CRISPR-associated CARF protein [Alteribacter salitolerans]
MSVGHDISPLILWIEAIKPERVFFICSPDTIDYVNDIVEETGLKVTQVEYDSVSRIDASDVYQAIKHYVEKHQIHFFSKVAIDITGGKKSMISGCSLAANHLGIDILYIENNGHYPGHKVPEPGRETPTVLEDPLEVFGDRDLLTGIHKFNSEDFENAIEIFQQIQERVINPRKYQAYEHLATAYSHLESMVFDEAQVHIEKTIQIAELLELREIPVDKLKQQLTALAPLGELHKMSDERILSDGETYWHLFGYLFQLANHYRKRKKYDLTALLTYRCLEMIVQRLLLKRGISASRPKFGHLDYGSLINKVNEISKEIFHEFREIKTFGSKISLMQGLLILKALDEPLLRDIKLKSINNFINLRNKSRLIHGFELLDEERVSEFYGRIRGLNNKIWNEQRSEIQCDWSFDTFAKHFRFVDIEVTARR